MTQLDTHVKKQLAHWTKLQSIIVPVVAQVSDETQKSQRMQMDTRRQQMPLVPGQMVMAIDSTRGSKWDPVYEGPFTVNQ